MKVLVSTFNQKTALVVVVGGAFSEIVKASPMQWSICSSNKDTDLHPRGLEAGDERPGVLDHEAHVGLLQRGEELLQVGAGEVLVLGLHQHLQ